MRRIFLIWAAVLALCGTATAADWSKPVITDTYVNVLGYLDGRLDDAATMFATEPTNAPTGAIHWNDTSKKFEKWSGSAWGDLAALYAISINGNAATATTAGTATSAVSLLTGLGNISQNDSTTQGNVKLTSSKGGYAGFYFVDPNRSLLIGSSYNGLYNPSQGWLWQWDNPTVGASTLLTGIIPPARISPQGSGSGLDADTIQGKTPTQLGSPPGTVITFAGASCPSGYLNANGAAVSRTTYADLFGAIGTYHGSGDGSTTFNVPDLRGEFVRYLDQGAGRDAGRTLGSFQDQSYQSHAHSGSTTGAGAHSHTVNGGGGSDLSNIADAANEYAGATVSTSAVGDHSHGLSISASGGAETRPRNRAMLGCIKY